MDSNAPGSGEPEYLGHGATAPRTGPDPVGPTPPRRRRTAVLATTGVAVAAVLGVGVWGVTQFLSGGDQPATALPATTAAFVSVDLDPSAGQKIDAIRTLKRFPGLAEHLDLGARDDVRRYVFEQLAESGRCTDVDYDKDIKPWIGERMAVAAVPDAGKAVPVLALQAGDEDAARAAVTKLDGCADGDSASGVAYRHGYLLVSDTQEHADLVAAAVDDGTLADDAGYRTWMGRVGDPGVVTGYAAASAPKLVEDAVAKRNGMFPAGADDLDHAFAAYQHFQGAAMVVRFGNGSLETDLVTKGLGSYLTRGDQAPSIDSLPATTALALSVGLHPGWLKGYLATLGKSLGADTVDHAMRQGERATGLNLPEDIETLFGDGVTVAVDGNVDLRQLASSPDPSAVPAALRITGDPSKIMPIIDKLTALAGSDASMVHVTKGAGTVTVGLSPSYVDLLQRPGALGSSTTFDEAVPDAAHASGLLYVSFDAGDWATRLGDLLSDDDPKVRENIAPLEALGISGWVDGDGVQHAELRLTTN